MLRLLLIATLLLAFPSSAFAGAKNSPAIAVLYFDNNSGDEELDVLSKGFADMLITDLSSTEVVTVVEREKLQDLLQEVKVQRNKFFDRKTAVKLGKGLGAKYVVSGSFMQVKPEMRIDVRLIDVATSKVVLATQVKGPADSVFALEQQLVGRFLEKLNHKFFAAKLPVTKTPNLKTLLSYSESLALVDTGETEKAAALMQKVVSQAPLFGLARSRHEEFVKRLAASATKRDALRDRDAKALYDEAQAFIKANPVASLKNQSEAQHYLAYRALLGLRFATALAAHRNPRSKRTLMVPRKSPGKVVGLLNAYYNHYRTLLLETRDIEARFGSMRGSLPRGAYEVARKLDLDIPTYEPSEQLVRFVFLGWIPEVGDQDSFTVAPPLANIVPKVRTAAETVIKTELARVAGGKASIESHQARLLEKLATWHINSNRVEQGILALQQIIDRFPNYHGWNRVQTRIQEQLGLKQYHEVTNRTKYEKGLATCEWWPYHVGLSTVYSRRLRSGGWKGVVQMEAELRKACEKKPEYTRMRKSLTQDLFLTAARHGDCESFDRYVKQWITLGGSTSEAAGYRKNWSDCR